MTTRSIPRPTWDAHLRDFHHDNPGVTQAVPHMARTTAKSAGLTVIADDVRRFAYLIHPSQAALRLVDSLYLPDVSARRRQTARLTATRWPTNEPGIPDRRAVASSQHDA